MASSKISKKNAQCVYSFCGDGFKGAAAWEETWNQFSLFIQEKKKKCCKFGFR